MRVQVEFLPDKGRLVACVRSTRLCKMCCACGVLWPSFVFQVITSLVDFYGMVYHRTCYLFPFSIYCGVQLECVLMGWPLAVVRHMI